MNFGAKIQLTWFARFRQSSIFGQKYDFWHSVYNHSKLSLNILQAKSSSPQGIKVSQGEKTLKVDIEQGSQWTLKKFVIT